MDADIPYDVLSREFEQDFNPYGSSRQDIEELLSKPRPYLEEGNYDLFLENDTFKIEECVNRYFNESIWFAEKYTDGYCETTFDSISCWPPTPLNSTVIISCFSEFRGVLYDATYNVSKRCMDNGNWSQSLYTCPPIIEHETGEKILTTTTIYFTGYILSLLASSIAIAIFAYFKELRCLRNRIHTNLMCAHMCVYFMWIITLVLELNFLNFKSDRPCIVLMILLHYFHLTTFFWMFVEGLYLYILVVKTLTRENYKLRVYACIGWGTPSVFIAIWAVVRSFLSLDSSQEDMSAAILFLRCPWLKAHTVDLIHQVPVIIVLLLNLFFLVSIMWVLITKLRSANTVETQQYRKAAKALLVLMPLLGVTYVLMITAPTGEAYIMTMLYYGRAVLLSTQGFTVALFYCFLNTEVQNTLKHRLETWKTSRSLGQRGLRSESRSKDWSPRSRTESIRNTEWTLVPVEDFVHDTSGGILENGQRKPAIGRTWLFSQPGYKRESCTSELTTTTMVTVNGGHGGGGPNPRSPFLQPPKPSFAGNV